MTKLVIFDLDGTLLNSLQDLATSTNYALQRHGYPTHELPAFRYFVGNGIDKLLERALPEAERSYDNMLKIIMYCWLWLPINIMPLRGS